MKIEKVFENIADSLLHEDELTIPLRYKKHQSEFLNEPDAGLSSELTNVLFPAKTPQEAWRFSEPYRLRISCTTTDSIPSCTSSHLGAHA